jgi:hypothetical protein
MMRRFLAGVVLMGSPENRKGGALPWSGGKYRAVTGVGLGWGRKCAGVGRLFHKGTGGTATGMATNEGKDPKEGMVGE